MSGRIPPDTSVVIDLLAGDIGVVRALSQAGAVFVAAVVLGEPYYGAYKSPRAQESLSQIDEFAVASTLLYTDAETARVYGRIKNRLRAKGRPIPENDVWLAAVARQHGLTLMTRDAHFTEVEEPKTQKP